MRHIAEYRNGELARALLQSLRAKVARLGRLRFMEVCGTHTVSIFRSGLRSVLPREIELISGPGCPVCVTAQGDLDKAIELARLPNVIVVTFGDMLKVPGTRSNLRLEKARGADVRIVYSPMDALEIARSNPGKNVVFFGVGFETTTPAVALTVQKAYRLRLDNFYLLSVHKLVPPALVALLDGKAAIDGFILPGHVSAIIGVEAYRFLAADYSMPSVVSGFEPLDIIQSIVMLVDQVATGRAEVENQYRRVVSDQGNRIAQRTILEVFEPIDVVWRGIGRIGHSGLRLRGEYSCFDAERAFDIDVSYSREPAGCSCGAILKGVKNPFQCRLFGKDCTPEHPVGPCMVSSEGTCAAYYHYGRGGVG